MIKLNKDFLKNITILYVEDESSIREEMEFFLSNFLNKLYVASNGEEGLKLYHEVKPDLIITDIQMPVMDGLEMLEKIDEKNLPVIVTTAYSDVKFFLKAIELKVNKFIIKPVDLSELVNSIQHLVIESNIKDRLFEKEKLLEIIDQNVLISVTNTDGVILDVSHAFCDFVEYSKDELVGKNHSLLKHEDTPDEFYKDMWEQITSGKVFKAEIKNRKKSGEIYWANLTITPVIKADEIINFTSIRQDITNKKRQEELAIRDELTSLYNRRFFNETIEKEIRRVKRIDSSLSLVILDVDYFKRYNDTYGHPEGDKVLTKIAQVLEKYTSRSSDYSFRLGGEEFGIIFSGLNIDESIKYTNGIISAIENLKIEHKNSKCSKYVTLSAGLLVESSKSLENEKLMYKYADEALYEAKTKGRNQLFLSNYSQ